MEEIKKRYVEEIKKREGSEDSEVRILLRGETGRKVMLGEQIDDKIKKYIQVFKKRWNTYWLEHCDGSR